MKLALLVVAFFAIAVAFVAAAPYLPLPKL
jgi:hypothetical protein